jgi:RNA polymerase primary sigma factor
MEERLATQVSTGGWDEAGRDFAGSEGQVSHSPEASLAVRSMVAQVEARQAAAETPDDVGASLSLVEPATPPTPRRQPGRVQPTVRRQRAEADVNDVRSGAPEGDISYDLFKQYLKEIGRHPLLKAEQEVDLSKKIEAGLYADNLLFKLRGEEDTEPLTDAETDSVMRLKEACSDEGNPDGRLERELEIIANQGEEAKEKMLVSNLRLVVSVAKRYTGHGMLILDLVEEGNIGLIRAVEKFDYTKGFKFSTYATWWIRQAITRAMADQARTIRLPVHQVERINKVRRVGRDLEVELGRLVTTEDIAQAMKMPVKQVEELRRISLDPISLFMPLSGGSPGTVHEAESEFGDVIEDTEAAQAINGGVMHTLLRENLEAVLNRLSDKEATIIRLRHGLIGGREHTLDEIGVKYGVTRERIRQLEKQGMARIKDMPDIRALHVYMDDF